MGIFCCGSDAGKQEVEEIKRQLDAREQQLHEQELQLTKDRKAFEASQNNTAFVNEDVNQEIDRELKTLREQNEKLTRDINKRNRELNEIKRKVKVLEQRLVESTPSRDPSDPDLDEKIVEGKRRAVIEEDEDSQVNDVVLKRHSKAVKTTTMLKSALKDCDLLKALDLTHIEAIVDVMDSRTYRKGDFVIREGDDATEMFVLESGDVEVSHDEVDGSRQKIKRMAAPATFGEIALLFNTKRTANIIATSECVIWTIDRRRFKKNHAKYK